MGAVLCAAGSAQAAVTGVNPDTDYHVTYQVTTEQAKTVSSVKVVDIIEFGDRPFLVIYLPGYRTKAYLDLSSVRSIIPASSGLSKDLP
ncbi:MAG: hypothetical protein HY353_05110 [Candidatus Omnitrophica bacterium]|nr:hypothetical protein [Candidatus Omnitrophota bacterium]